MYDWDLISAATVEGDMILECELKLHKVNILYCPTDNDETNSGLRKVLK
jgi:hypothetical protein